MSKHVDVLALKTRLEELELRVKSLENKPDPYRVIGPKPGQCPCGRTPCVCDELPIGPLPHRCEKCDQNPCICNQVVEEIKIVGLIRTS